MRLLIATRNHHKLREIKSILDLPGVEIVGVDSIPGLPEVEEDGATFEENARKKAVTIAAASGLLTMADDSGLEVDALGGAPGVYSARYAGEECDDSANNSKLLRELDGVEDRSARFRCVIALAYPDGRCMSVDGCCEGRIATEPRGENGFGYDPLFIPEGGDRSFAEIGDMEKSRISHRARALEAARRRWWDDL